MRDQRATSDSMSLEEATVFNIWEIAPIVEVLERKGLCTKQDLSTTASPNFAARIPVPAFLRRPSLSRTSSTVGANH
jgi:hypothetical protein